MSVRIKIHRTMHDDGPVVGKVSGTMGKGENEKDFEEAFSLPREKEVEVSDAVFSVLDGNKQPTPVRQEDGTTETEFLHVHPFTVVRRNKPVGKPK